ncbi:UNVERIFIED_CONTAM: hypothetical protein FKN15_043795 [Acipenser sinensis]
MTSLSINTILAALTHRPDQPLNRLLWNVPPLFLYSCSQLAKVGWSWLSPVDGTGDLVPQMFYWTQVRRKSWPTQDLDIVFLKSCNCNPSTVWSCIVLLENRHFRIGLQEWKNCCLKDFVSVSLSSKVALNLHQRHSCVKGDSSPHHHTSTAPPVAFNNGNSQHNGPGLV